MRDKLRYYEVYFKKMECFLKLYKKRCRIHTNNATKGQRMFLPLKLCIQITNQYFKTLEIHQKDNSNLKIKMKRNSMNFKEKEKTSSQ